MQDFQETTQLLKQWQSGDTSAFEIIIERVYSDLKDIAHQKLWDEFRGSGLDTTELLNEACILMMGKRSIDWQSRKHFLYTAGKAMYLFLIDLARRRHAKRNSGGWVKLYLEEEHGARRLSVEQILQVDEVLKTLGEEDPLLVEVVQLRFFAGYTIQETSEILEMPTITINRKWAFAKAVLKEHLKE